MSCNMKLSQSSKIDYVTGDMISWYYNEADVSEIKAIITEIQKENKISKKK